MSDSIKAKKNYIKGSAREVVFSDGNSLINLDMKLEDLQKIVNERGYVRVVVSKLKATDQYDNTHSVYENDYKPKEGAKAPTKPSVVAGAKPKATASASTDDLPF